MKGRHLRDVRFAERRPKQSPRALPRRSVRGDEALTTERAHDGVSDGLVAPDAVVGRIRAPDVLRLDGPDRRHAKVVDLDGLAVLLEELRGEGDARTSRRPSDFL